jgi:hypothetical protein
MLGYCPALGGHFPDLESRFQVSGVGALPVWASVQTDKREIIKSNTPGPPHAHPDVCIPPSLVLLVFLYEIVWTVNLPCCFSLSGAEILKRRRI